MFHNSTDWRAQRRPAFQGAAEQLDATKRTRTDLARNHSSVARMIGWGLEHASAQIWWGFSAVAYARLTVRERATLGFFSLCALDLGTAKLVADAAINQLALYDDTAQDTETEMAAAGPPLPPLVDELDEARQWAAMASEDERKAYALAAYEAMGAHNKRAFAAFVAGDEP